MSREPKDHTPEEFRRFFLFHGTDDVGATQIRKTGKLRRGSSVSHEYAVARSFTEPGGKLTGGYNRGNGSVFAVHRFNVEDAEIKLLLKRADELKAKGMSEEDAINQANDEQENDRYVGHHERILQAEAGPLHEIPGHRARTAEEAHTYLTGRER